MDQIRRLAALRAANLQQNASTLAEQQDERALIKAQMDALQARQAVLDAAILPTLEADLADVRAVVIDRSETHVRGISFDEIYQRPRNWDDTRAWLRIVIDVSGPTCTYTWWLTGKGMPALRETRDGTAEQAARLFQATCEALRLAGFLVLEPEDVPEYRRLKGWGDAPR